MRSNYVEGGRVTRKGFFVRILEAIHRARRPDAHRPHLLQGEITLVHGVLDAAGDALDDAFRAALGLGADAGLAEAAELRPRSGTVVQLYGAEA